MKRTLLALLFIGSVSFAHALTLAEIETAVRRNVRDTASSSSLQKYSDAYLDVLINEGQRDVINQTWAISKSSSITLVDATASYSLPSDLITIWRATRQNENLLELDFPQQDADAADESWETQAGEPRYFYTSFTTPQSVTLYPVPTSTYAGTLKVFYFSYATDLSSDSDEPFNSIDRLSGYHDLLVYYPTIRILMAENMQDKAAPFIQLYQSGVQTMAENVGAKKIKTPPIKVTTKP